jgi:hypothetical protein
MGTMQIAHAGLRRVWGAAALALGLLLGLSPSLSAQTTLTETQAKAAFILNFARYIEWPASAFASREAPVVACVVGRDTLGPALSALEGRPVQGRPLKVRRGVVPDDTRGCHVVFIGEAEERRIVPVLRALAGQPILTVSDTEHFIDIGGAIGIVAGDDRLQFEVNRTAIDQAQLKASANLLKLARNLL